MHLASIDQMANNGNSIFHRAKTVTKLLLSLMILIVVLLSHDIVRLAGITLALAGMFFLAGVPLKEVFHLALYPAFFSLFFALFKLQQSWIDAILIIMKSVTAALSLLLLITTTSYVKIFGFLSLFLPSVLVDIFLFTYRSFFILVEMLQNLLKSIKLRGGYHFFRIVANLKSNAGAIGVMIIHAFDMSERMYRIYSLRGYNGKIIVNPERSPLTRSDFFVILVGIGFLLWMVIPWNL